MVIETDDIIEYVGETFAERGETYYEEGRIVSPRIDGDRLTAECYGSEAEPYRVEVRIGDGVVESNCTCPVRGPCKHVAALLYAYVRDRETFADPGRLRERLEEMPRRELVALVMGMVERFREAERYLEQRLLEREGASEFEGDEVRRHAVRAFESAFERASGHGFDEVVARIVDDLERLAAVGARHRDAGRLRQALAVWAPIVDVAADYDFDAGRGYDELFGFLGELEEAIIGLLPDLDRDRARAEAFETLWQLFELDLDHGGIDLAQPFWRAVREGAEDREVRALVERARARRDEERAADWPDERAGRLLLRFLEEFGDDELDVETRLEAYEELGAAIDVVSTLLDVGRVEEAAERVAAIDYSRDFVGGLEHFVESGYAETAERLARERLDRRGHDHTVQAWLVDLLVDRDRGGEALEVAMTMLEQHPNREDFERVELLARGLDRWDEVRERALEILREDAPRAYLQYVLDEDAVGEAAVEVWEREFAPRTHETWRASDLELELADRIEEGHPGIAIRIWRREVDALVESGGADDYRRAAELLGRIESVLERQGADERWRAIRDDSLEAADGDGWRRALDEAGLLT